MILAIALGISVLMAWLGVKKGVYVMAAALFNLLIAFYVSLLAIPLVFKTSPVETPVITRRRACWF